MKGCILSFLYVQPQAADAPQNPPESTNIRRMRGNTLDASGAQEPIRGKLSVLHDIVSGKEQVY